jgi:hypothetical protein
MYPQTLSSAQSLPVLFHTGSAPGVRPSELCSSRTGGCRLRYRCPLAVGIASVQLHGWSRRPSQLPRTCAWPRFPPIEAFAERPSASGFCSVRESAHSKRWFRPIRARGSPGLRPLQGVHPPRTGRDLRRVLPSCGLRTGRLRPVRATSGCRIRRGWLVSRETADPPGVSYLLASHERLVRLRFWSHPLEVRGASPSPRRLRFEPSLRTDLSRPWFAFR